MTRPTSELLDERKKFLEVVSSCVKDASLFSEIFLGHKLYPYNAEYVNCLDRFIIYRSGRQSGKTMSTAVKAIHFAFFAPLILSTVKKDCTIVIAAPTQNQAAIMFDRIRTLIEGSDFLRGYIIRNTQTELWVNFLDDTGLTKIITRATGESGITLRGYSPHVIIADECSFIKTSILRAFLPSGMATNARVWLTSTPFSKNNFFYEACMNSRPKNPTGLWREFHVSSLQNPSIKNDPLFVEQIKQLAQEEYIQEVEGEFLDIGNALIPNTLLMDAISDKQPVGQIRYYMGVDVARTGKDETVYCVIAVDEEDKVYVLETVPEAQSNLVEVAGRIGEYCRKYPIETVFIDETGLGGGVVDLARKQELPARGVIFTLKEKSSMYSNIRVLFENHRVKIRELGKLIYQLSYLKREYTEQGILKVKTEDGIHDDYADAFALACKSVETGDTWHIIEVSKNLKDAVFG